MRMYQITAFASCISMLTACASGRSPIVNVPAPVVEKLETVTPGTNPPENISVSDVLNDLQGTWVGICQFLDPEDPDGGYEMSTLKVTGSDVNVETVVYSDSNCINRLERGFAQLGSSGQFSGFLALPGGSAATSPGASAFMDITFNKVMIDNQPLDPSVAAFFPEETTFDIVFVDGNTLYRGLLTDRLDAETSVTRPQQLNVESPFTRQL